MRHRIVIAPVLLALMLFKACPTQSDLTRMAKASNELGHDTVVAEKTVAAFYQAGRISKERKDFYADKLKVIAVKGKAFNDLLVSLDKQYPEGSLPPDQTQAVRDLWAPLALLIGSVVSDIASDGMKAGKLDEHAKTISGVLQ
ncbi:MAG TPA: hypothetical protein VIX17_11545 [Pyrinomonadaceae bacterium]